MENQPKTWHAASMATIDASGTPDFEAAPGLLVHRKVTIKTDPGEGGVPYAMTATVEPQDGVYVVTELTLTQAEGGAPIQRGELAKIRTENFIRMAASKSLGKGVSNGWEVLGEPGPEDEFYDRVKESGMPDSGLADLAKAYRWIRLQEGKPTTLLAQEFDVSQATVKRWLARAVEGGFLTQEERVR